MMVDDRDDVEKDRSPSPAPAAVTPKKILQREGSTGSDDLDQTGSSQGLSVAPDDDRLGASSGSEPGVETPARSSSPEPSPVVDLRPAVQEVQETEPADLPQDEQFPPDVDSDNAQEALLVDPESEPAVQVESSVRRGMGRQVERVLMALLDAFGLSDAEKEAAQHAIETQPDEVAEEVSVDTGDLAAMPQESTSAASTEPVHLKPSSMRQYLRTEQWISRQFSHGKLSGAEARQLLTAAYARLDHALWDEKRYANKRFLKYTHDLSRRQRYLITSFQKSNIVIALLRLVRDFFGYCMTLVGSYKAVARASVCGRLDQWFKGRFDERIQAFGGQVLSSDEVGEAAPVVSGKKPGRIAEWFGRLTDRILDSLTGLVPRIWVYRLSGIPVEVMRRPKAPELDATKPNIPDAPPPSPVSDDEDALDEDAKVAIARGKQEAAAPALRQEAIVREQQKASAAAVRQMKKDIFEDSDDEEDPKRPYP